MAWNKTEEECYKYILSILPHTFTAEQLGGSDSTCGDIKILKNDTLLTCVEVKEATSQAGQFVIEPSSMNDRYIFSKGNKTSSKYCQPIIDYLNDYFEKFKFVAQNSIRVDCPNTISISRIINEYLYEKNTNFFITKDNTNYLIFKTEDLGLYFDVECNLRRKKSGSSGIPKSDYNKVIELINEYLKSLNIKGNAYGNKNDEKMYVQCEDSNKQLKGTRIEFDALNYTIFFSYKDHNFYELRKLSKTNNPNIIFTLTLKKNHPNSDITAFLNFLR